MINDLDETIKTLLVQGVPLDLSEVDVVFDAPTNEWSTSLARPTVNCYLYHLAENHELRQVDWKVDRALQARQNGNIATHSITRKRTPFRIDASYMVTAWANVVEDEHRVLWRVLAALIKYSNLPEHQLQGSDMGQPYSMPIKVAQPDGVFKNPSDFWSGMEVHVKPSVNFVITLPLDPDMFIEAPLVLTRRVHLGPTPNSGSATGSAYEVATVQFGGWVLQGSGDNAETVPGAEVLIVEKGLSAQTDDAGRFKFTNVPRGTYTLKATAEGGVAERQIDVPGEGYDLTLTGRADGEASSREKGSPPDSRQGGKGRRR